MLTILRCFEGRSRLTLDLIGELDMMSRPQLLAQVGAALAELRPAEVTLRLRGLSFLDACGLGAFLSLQREAAARGCAFRMLDAQPPVLRVLTITGCVERLNLVEAPSSAQVDEDAPSRLRLVVGAGPGGRLVGYRTGAASARAAAVLTVPPS